MAAPTTPPEPAAPMVVVASSHKPWTAKMLDDWTFARVGSRRNPGYAISDVDAFKSRAVARVTQLEADVTHWHGQAMQSRKALRRRADSEGPYYMGETPDVAVDAVAGGQRQAEDELADARAEAKRILGAARLQASEAEEYLRRARDAATTGLTETELPDPPNPTGDPVADLEARSEWIRECQRIVDEQRQEIDQRREALDDQRRGFVALLDRLEAAVPGVRAQLTVVEAEAAKEVAS